MSGVTTERLYKSADGRYVAESDPDAAFLVAAVGQPIPDDYDSPVAEPVAADPVPVGDHGPEVVTPPAPAKVKPAAKKATPAPVAPTDD